MSLRIRRGTDSQRQGITPLEGELIYATDTKKLYVGDGSTGGGIVVDSSAGTSVLNDLANVTAPSPNVNDIIKWSGSAWVTAAQNSGSVLNDLSDVSASAKDVGDVLKWNGTQYISAPELYQESATLKNSIVADDSTLLVDTFRAELRGKFRGIGEGDWEGNFKGSVFAENSSMIIDGVAGRVVGETHGNHFGDVFASDLTNRVLDNGTNGKDAIFFGNTEGVHTGDMTGSVFADDSTLLVDGVNGKIVGEINTTSKIYQTMDGNDSGIEIKGISTGSPGPDLKYSASRGTIASPATLQAADTILDVIANGYDGTDHLTPAVIMKLGVDKYTSSVASNVMPGRFVVLTYNESGTTSLDNALVFNRFGRLCVGDDNPTEKLDVRGNIKATGGYIGGVQAISGPGAIDITTLHTEITTTGADAFTLANGQAGQLKIISMKVDGGNATLTPTTLANGTTITFDDVNDSVTMIYSGLGWLPIAVQGATVA